LIWNSIKGIWKFSTTDKVYPGLNQYQFHWGYGVTEGPGSSEQKLLHHGFVAQFLVVKLHVELWELGDFVKR
jgi:hypothetical protein